MKRYEAKTANCDKPIPKDTMGPSGKIDLLYIVES